MRRHRTGRRLAASAALVGLAGMCAACAPSARLEVAPAVFAAEWQAPVSSGRVDAASPKQDLWPAFRSPVLEQLITRARAANVDVAIARARIVQARGQLGVARAAAFPTLSANANSSFLRQAAAKTKPVQSTAAAGGLDVAYELDLFGVNSSAKRSAQARLAAAVQDREATRLAVESQVARTYIEFATLRDRLVVLDKALANAKELERVIRIRVREGDASEADLGFQTVEVRGIEADRTSVVEAADHARNALAVLLGEEAPLFRLEEASLAGLDVPGVAVVQPGALLTRRPDVLGAEARIAAANGDVSRARAAFLPNLSLSAGSLWRKAGGGPLQLALSAGASLLAPIFDGGRLRGDLLTATGAQQEAVENYRQALLKGLQESEDALTAVAQSKAREAILADAVKAARRTAQLARMQYVAGDADLQTVLNAERGLLSVEEALTVTKQDRLNAAVDLYKAMGGGPSPERDADFPSHARHPAELKSICC